MPANDEEKTPLLDTRCNRALYQQQQQHHHHVISVPTVVKDSTSYQVIYASSDYSHGLSLEELLQYANDPKWVLLRRTFVGLFGLTLLLTFLAACTLAYFHHADDDYCSTLATTIVPSVNKVNAMTTTLTMYAAQNSTESSGGSSSRLMNILP